MAEMLFDLLYKIDCTVHEIRSFLESQPDVQSIINQLNEARSTPIIVAVMKRKSVDIMEELLKHGADANQDCHVWVPLTAVWFFGYGKRGETYCCDTIRLLIKYGADVNKDIGNCSVFYTFVSSNYFARKKIFIPMIQIMLPYADTSAKMEALNFLIKHVLHCPEPYEEQGETENYIQAVQLLLKSGASLMLGFTVSIFLLPLQFRLHYADIDPAFVMIVFKMVLPYLFMQCVSENALNEMQIRVDGVISDVSRPSCCSDNLYDLLLGLWNACAVDCHEMQSDMTKEGSILQILEATCGIESKKRNVTGEAAFEVLLRFAQNKYPCFQDIMSDTIKNSDMRELYVFIFKELSGEISLLHPDSFYCVANYLEKDDLFNFLLAFLPRQV